jgi:hypothetical protein
MDLRAHLRAKDTGAKEIAMPNRVVYMAVGEFGKKHEKPMPRL